MDNYKKYDSIEYIYNYKKKYLKYKNKYIQLKNQQGGLSCFGLGCARDATINIEDDFDKILPDNDRNKPIINNNTNSDSDINMDDGKIIIKEKPDPKIQKTAETNNSFLSKLFSNDK